MSSSVRPHCVIHIFPGKSHQQHNKTKTFTKQEMSSTQQIKTVSHNAHDIITEEQDQNIHGRRLLLSKLNECKI
jgi:LmbE family N-acetylglucosaminyl deacetylase